MFCEKCGSPIGDNDCFCAKCGNQLNNTLTPDDNQPLNNENVCIVAEDETESLAVNNAVDTSDNCSVSEESADAVNAPPTETIENSEICIEAENKEKTVQDENVSNETVTTGIDASGFGEIDSPESAEAVTPSENQDDDSSNPQNVVQDVQKETIAEAVVSRRNTRKPSVGAHILSVFLSIILSLTVILTVAVAIVQNVIESETISAMLSDVDIEDIEINDVADKKLLEESGLKINSDNVLDIIYDNIDQTALADPLTKEEFSAIVENEAFSTYIGEKLSENISDVTKGKSSELLSIDDVCGFFEDESDTIAGIIGYEITEERIENLRVTLEYNYGDMFDGLKIDDFDDGESKAVSAGIIIVCSEWFLIILIVIDVLLTILIFLILRSFRYGFIYVGIVCTAVGAIYTLALLTLIIAFFTIFVQGLIAELVTPLINIVVIDALIISASIFGAGILMLIVAKLIKIIQKKRMLSK